MPELSQQELDAAIDVLGRFVTAGVSGRRFQAKLKVHANGHFEFQESGFATMWNRTANDSLTNPRVHGAVADVFAQCRRLIRTPRYAEREQLYRRMLYGLRGYHTLVKEGYPGLRGHVKGIARQTRDLIGNSQSLGQGISLYNFKQNDFPIGRGCCWGFTMDWLRRCFRGRYTYNTTNHGRLVDNFDMKAKVNRKLDNVKHIQDDQTFLKTATDGGVYNENYILYIFPGGPAPVTRGINPTAPTADRKFGGMTMHPLVPGINIPVAHQRFYGNSDGSERPPRFETLQTAMQERRQALIPQYGDPTLGIGWLITMQFGDFWADRQTSGHAVGAFWTPDGRAKFFDPNYGYASMADTAPQGPQADNNFVADTWRLIEKLVILYSMGDAAVQSVDVYPVTYQPAAAAAPAP